MQKSNRIFAKTSFFYLLIKILQGFVKMYFFFIIYKPIIL